MKKTILYTIIMATLVFMACNTPGTTGPAFESKESIKTIIGQLNDEFGQKAAFESIVLGYDPSIGNSIIINYNLDKSTIIKERQFKSGLWEDLGADTMQIESGKPEDFLFSLNDFDLNKIPDLVTDAKSRLSKQNNSKDAMVGSATISLPTEVDDKKTDLTYSISIETNNGDSTYYYTYDVNGKFKEMSTL